MKYKKNFDGWNEVKKDLDNHLYKPPLFKERDIWWCSFGVNIGSEVCGKNLKFRRPILIVKKLSQTSFVGIPLSTQHSEGSWYIEITHSKGVKNIVNLAQIKYIDFRRLDKKISSLDTNTFTQVKKQLRNLLDL